MKKKKKKKETFVAKFKRRIKKAMTLRRHGFLWQYCLRFFWGRPFISKCIQAWAKKHWKIDPQKIVFATFSHTFTCNPSYIAQTLAERGYPGKLVFLVNKYVLPGLKKSEAAKKITFVDVWSWRALREAATARVRLENAQTFLWPSFTPKRPGQLYINTWHGSLGIKRLDTAVGLGKRASLSKKYTDYCISNSDFEDMVMETSFFPNVPKVRLGHARNDIFFQPEEDIARIKAGYLQKFGLSESCKLALYAPTFRDKTLFKGFLQIDYQTLTEVLQQRFGGEWKILVKLHPHDVMRMKYANQKLPPTVIDASICPDMNDLLLATDVGISDYSSWVFDYIHLRRPGFIYAPDLKHYKRGFYYPLTDTPFPVTVNDQELCDAIVNFDEPKYLSDIEAFLEKMGCVDDGKSCGRIADFLESIIPDQNNIQKEQEQ